MCRRRKSKISLMMIDLKKLFFATEHQAFDIEHECLCWKITTKGTVVYEYNLTRSRSIVKSTGFQRNTELPLRQPDGITVSLPPGGCGSCSVLVVVCEILSLVEFC